ncbi:MAG: helix-hairpin-helix domain-containing protein, partial [Actinomycetes bacterium]
VDRFGSLQKLLRASAAEMCAVEGIGEVRATSIRDGLDRISETARLDRS